MHITLNYFKQHNQEINSVSVFCTATSCFYNCLDSVRHTPDKHFTPFYRNCSPSILQISLHCGQIPRLVLSDSPLQIKPQIFYGVKVWTLWWPVWKFPNVVLLFPQLENACSVTCSAVILKEEVIPIAKVMSRRNGRVLEDVNVSQTIQISMQFG